MFTASNMRIIKYSQCINSNTNAFKAVLEGDIRGKECNISCGSIFICLPVNNINSLSKNGIKIIAFGSVSPKYITQPSNFITE